MVEKACMSLGVSLSVSGFVLPTNTRRPNNRFSRKGLLKGKEIKKADKIPDNISQATLNNQAREAIKDLFPKIPDKDLHAIVNRAFQKV